MRSRLAILLAVSVAYASPACTQAQSTIGAFEGLKWGSPRAELLRRFGTPREDVTANDLEKVSYVQGPDSGYLFVIHRKLGLVGAVRILPLPSGKQCATVVSEHEAAIARQYPTLRPVSRKVPDPTGGSCGGMKEWTTIWEDADGNRLVLATEFGANVSLPKGVEHHRLYLQYSSSAGSAP